MHKSLLEWPRDEVFYNIKKELKPTKQLRTGMDISLIEYMWVPNLHESSLGTH